MSNKSTLFERIGGEDAVNATVERFYVNLLSNELTKPFFVTTDIDKLRNHQKRFLTYAFGGPSKYTGRTMRAAHQRMHITNEHFLAVTTVLQNTFEEMGVPDDLIMEVMEIVNATKDDIVNA